MLGASGGRLAVGNDGVEPATGAGGVRVISSDLLLPDGAPLRWDEPARFRHVWRGTLEAGMLREFLSDVRWGALDVLLVDLPPGRDRLDALAEVLPRLPGVVVVTIPSEASFRSVRRAVEAAREAGLPVYGVVENMAGYRCPGCAADGPLFRGDAGERLAREAQAPLLARVPFDPRAQDAADAGDPGAAADALAGAASSLASRLEAA
jgi:ATP-binding protein involved in chromosome partitioning